MKKDDLMKIDGMTEELATAVEKASADELKGYIPKSRFDEINNAKKELEGQIADRDKQLKDLADKVKDNEALTQQISDLQEQNKTAKAEYDEKIKTMKLESAMKEKLTDAKYPDLLMSKFDRTKLVLNDDGTVTGLDEQLRGLKETYKDMFNQPLGGKTPPQKTGGSNGGQPMSAREQLEKIISDTQKYSLAERVAARNKLFEITQNDE